MDRDPRRLHEYARLYFTKQAQLGRRVVFAWEPGEVSGVNPLTLPWPGAGTLYEGVEFEDEGAARRFDLERVVGESGRPPGGDVTDVGPYVEFFSWAEAVRWLRAQPGEGG